MDSKQNLDSIKGKIRKLKQFERKIRFNYETRTKECLIWDDFFDLHDVPLNKAKYTLGMMTTMSRDEYKNMIFALLC